LSDPYWAETHRPKPSDMFLPIEVMRWLDNFHNRETIVHDSDFAGALILRAPQTPNPQPLNQAEWLAIFRGSERAEFQNGPSWHP
jgi:hypothetical protein